MTKIQATTGIFLIAWIIWEIYIGQWAKTQIGATIRVDLILIYPTILILSIISLIQFLKTRK